jgi:glutaconyl-CoA decarboxylase
MSGEMVEGAVESGGARRPIVGGVARTGRSGRTTQGDVERPGKTREALDSVAAAAALSAAARRFLSGRAACLDARDAVRRASPWTIVGRLDAMGMDGFHRLRMEARKRPMQTFEVTIGGHVYQVTVEEVRRPAAPPAVVRPAKGGKTAAATSGAAHGGTRVVRAPIPGKILAVNVGQGDSVDTGAVLLVLEAMKMENDVLALAEGAVQAVHVRPGDTVNAGDVMLVME